MLIDSHCHLQMIDYEQLQSDMPAVLRAAEAAGVIKLLCVATDFSEHEVLRRIADEYAQVSISVGLHPNESHTVAPDLDLLLRLGAEPKVVALGETGLDYYRDRSEATAQKEWFLTHIEAARQLQKPLIIHTRRAKADTLMMAKTERLSEVGAVLHCFTEDWEMASQALDLGLYLSFSGIITFKNATDLREVVKKTPLSQLLIETDSPFLAPVPHRGHINQPAYVKKVAQHVADIKGIPFEAVAFQTTENARTLFKLP